MPRRRMTDTEKQELEQRRAKINDWVSGDSDGALRTIMQSHNDLLTASFHAMMAQVSLEECDASELAVRKYFIDASTRSALLKLKKARDIVEESHKKRRM